MTLSYNIHLDRAPHLMLGVRLTANSLQCPRGMISASKSQSNSSTTCSANLGSRIVCPIVCKPISQYATSKYTIGSDAWATILSGAIIPSVMFLGRERRIEQRGKPYLPKRHVRSPSRSRNDPEAEAEEDLCPKVVGEAHSQPLHPEQFMTQKSNLLLVEYGGVDTLNVLNVLISISST